MKRRRHGHRNRPATPTFELLESRELLAVDLVVEQLTPLPDVTPGEQITYQVRLTNNGPDDALAASFRDPVAQALDDVSWTRDATFEFAASSLDGSNGFVASAATGSVSNIGDLNADGIDDFAVGSWFSLGPTGTPRVGRIYVVFGSSNLGDDGRIEFSALSGHDGFVIYGSEEKNSSGVLVRAAGDVNADGVDDLLITSRVDAPSKNSTYVVFGAPDIGSGGVFRLSELDGNNGFSVDMRSVIDGPGDFNGDGIEDLFVAEAGFRDDTPDRGRAFVVYGREGLGASGTVVPSRLTDHEGVTIKATTPDANPFASSWGIDRVDIADINGDGMDDLLLATPGFVAGVDFFGAVHVVFGSRNSGVVELDKLDGRDGFAIPGNELGDQLGALLSGIGDINGDGFEDFSIGGSRGPLISEEFIVFGGEMIGRSGQFSTSSLDGSNGFKLVGIPNNIQENRFVRDIDAAGDVNGDGIGDFLIGVHGSAVSIYQPSPNPGTTYVVYGSDTRDYVDGTFDLSKLTADQGFVFQGSELADSGGADVSSAGDVNDDGVDDMLIAAFGIATTYVLFGRARPIISGSGQGDIGDLVDVRVGTTVTYTVTGTVPDGRTGRFVSKAVVSPSALQTELDPPDNSVPDVDPGLLVDLAVEFDGGPFEVNRGDEVTYTLRVENRGRDDAKQAAITHALSGTLADPTWTRRAEFEVDLQQLTPDVGFIVSGATPERTSEHELTSARDLNGDGFDDFAYAGGDDGNSYVLFGRPAFETTIDVSQLDGSLGFVVTGENSGYSVSGVGDMNGDGFDDLALGTRNTSTGHVSHVVFGRNDLGSRGSFELSQLDGTNGFSISNSNPDEGGSWKVFGAGDLNDDGFSDALFRSQYSKNLHVIFGGQEVVDGGSIPLSDLNGSDGFTIPDLDLHVSERLALTLDVAIAAGGDLNDDDKTDLLIVSPSAGSNSGALNVVYGGTEVGADGSVVLGELDGVNGVHVAADNNSFRLDSVNTVSIEGDINGDGFDDILLGSSDGAFVMLRDAEPIGELQGSDVFLFYSDGFGGPVYRVSHASDVNGDGFDDFLIATAYDFGRNESYLILGAADFGVTTKRILLFEINGRVGTVFRGVGGPVSGAGDIDGDGAGDFLIGQFALFGRPAFATGKGDIDELVDIPVGTTITYTVTGTVPDTVTGSVLSTATAVPGPEQIEYRTANNTLGYSYSVPAPDVVVRIDAEASLAFEGRKVSYMVRVSNISNDSAKSVDVSGDFNALQDVTWTRQTDFDPAPIDLTTLNRMNGFSVHGAKLRDHVGKRIGSAGDINADGFDDFVVAGESGTYVVFGRDIQDLSRLGLQDLDGTNGFLFDVSGLDAPDRFAIGDVSGAGDINADGIDDLLVGAPAASSEGQRFTGKVYVVFGSRHLGANGFVDLANLDGANGFVVNSHSGLGGDVDGAGDVNGDGIDDFLLKDGIVNTKWVAVVFGGPHIGAGGSLNVLHLDGSNGFIIRTSFAIGAVTSAGDLNADGFADVIIERDSQLGGVGHVFVVFGGTNVGTAGVLELSELDGTNGFRMSGPLLFRRNVHGGSDINGDAISDLVLGLPFSSPNGVGNAGQVQVIFGRPGIGHGGALDISPTQTGDVQIIGGKQNESIGRHVTAADINADGVHDLIVSGSSGTHAIFGGAYFADADVVDLSSLGHQDRFVIDAGVSTVNQVGDVNGDGADDLLFGDRNANRNGVKLAGAAYVLFGRSGTQVENLTDSIDLPPGGTVTYTVTGIIPSSSPPNLTVSATAVLGGRQLDPDTSDSSAAVTTNVVAPLPGDIDLDGQVAFSDFLVLASNFGREDDVGRDEGDLDDDGKVRFSDFVILSDNFGRKFSAENP